MLVDAVQWASVYMAELKSKWWGEQSISLGSGGDPAFDESRIFFPRLYARFAKEKGLQKSLLEGLCTI